MNRAHNITLVLLMLATGIATADADHASAQQDVSAIDRGHSGIRPPSAAEEQPLFLFPPRDGTLQRGLNQVLSRRPFRSLVDSDALSVVLVDLTDPEYPVFAGVDEDHERYAASLPKIGILLGVLNEVEKGTLEYTPELRTQLVSMIRRSSNTTSSDLIRLIGFEAIEEVLTDPVYQLYDETRAGGIWVGKGYGGMGVWQRDPLSQLSHAATARQVARFLVMMQRGELVSPWASAEMKDVMGDPAIKHKFVLGLDSRPGSRIFRKSGTWRRYHADAALVERNGRRYVAVALLEAEQNRGYLSRLIVELDDLVFARAPRASGDDPR